MLNGREVATLPTPPSPCKYLLFGYAVGRMQRASGGDHGIGNSRNGADVEMVPGCDA
jgi:hypothetical protein